MKRKWFVLLAILTVAAAGLFITDQLTQAQRPGPSERGERRGGPPGGGGMMNPSRLIESSWADLTFGLKVDDQTLLKARPVHQKAWDDINKAVEDARGSQDWQSLRGTMRQINDEFMAGLKQVLTEEQLNKLRESQRARMESESRRRGRPGGNSNGGDN